jgi:phosphoglycolate phosphatase
VPAPYSSVLVDLDGTIVDSARGITASLAWTFEQLGLPVPTPAELLQWVGPPLLDAFRDLAGMSVDEAQAALALYRTHYGEIGVFDATVYPGVPDVLRAIHAAGVPLSLATSKPESLATRILDHFELSQFFDELTGASEDEVRSAKADVVDEALRRLRLRGADLANPIMIGDRIHDVQGAADHRVPTIFVTWGYGAPEEQAGAVAVVATADELLGALAL